ACRSTARARTRTTPVVTTRVAPGAVEPGPALPVADDSTNRAAVSVGASRPSRAPLWGLFGALKRAYARVIRPGESNDWNCNPRSIRAGTVHPRPGIIRARRVSACPTERTPARCHRAFFRSEPAAP